MKAFEDLTSRGQAGRIRPMAIALLDLHRRPFDSLSLIHHGENTTFRAQKNDAHYLCRIHRPGYQTLESIRSEMEFIDHCRKAGLKVPEAIYSKKKKEAVHLLSLETIDGVQPAADRFGVLFTWLHGTFRSKMSLRSAPRIGAYMAKMHLASERFKPSSSFYRPRLDEKGIYTVMGGNVDHFKPADREKIILIQEIAAVFFDEIGKDASQFGMVHNDFHAGNRLFVDGEIAAIDFDDCGWSWFIYDIAVCLSYHRSQDNYPAIVQAFFEGYRLVREISEEEEKGLELLVQVRRIQLLLWIEGRSDNPRFVTRLPAYLEWALESINAFLKKSTLT